MALQCRRSGAFQAVAVQMSKPQDHHFPPEVIAVYWRLRFTEAEKRKVSLDSSALHKLFLRQLEGMVFTFLKILPLAVAGHHSTRQCQEMSQEKQ